MYKVTDINEYKKHKALKKDGIKEAQLKINSLAQESGNISYTLHARERMLERDFIEKDIRDILRNGIIRKNPIKDENGCFRYKVEEIGF